MGATFSGKFLVRNMGKIVPHQNKNGVFGKSTKTGFTVLKYHFPHTPSESVTLPPCGLDEGVTFR